MQRASQPILMLLVAGFGAAGCRKTPTQITTAAPKTELPSLVLHCPDPNLSNALIGRATGWAAPLGRKVTAGAEESADVIVVRPTELGRVATAGLATPLPASFKEPGHPLQWSRFLPPYRGSLCGWAGETVAVPLAGDAIVLAYRADKFTDPAHQTGFQAKYGRSLQPPATWEDLADVAVYFAAADGKPSLPGVPTDPARLLTEFHAIAACYDRRALVDAELKDKEPPAGGFHTDPATGGHRLGSAGFRTAADWLARVAPHRGPEADPVTALTSGSAVAAVVTLAELGRLPKGPTGVADERVRVLPPPGSRTVFDPAGKAGKAANRGGNYVPFLGAGSWVAVVNAKRPEADTAWGLVAELAGPAASSARVSDPAGGAGPVRGDSGTAGLWVRYGFDPARNGELAAAVKQFVAVEVVNPALTLRTPDAAARLASLADAVRLAATGKATGEAAMLQAATAWDKQDAAAKPEDLKRWRRNAAGLP